MDFEDYKKLLDIGIACPDFDKIGKTIRAEMLLKKDNLMLPVYYPSTKEDFKDLIKSANINILLDYNGCGT